MKLGGVDHVEIGVRDAPRALGFYRDVVGLHDMGSRGETFFLGCGIDDRFDLAVTAGHAGLRHLAVRVDEDAIDIYAARLSHHGVAFDRRTDAEPGVRGALSFQLPSDHVMELVCCAESSYPKPFRPEVHRQHGAAPLDLDHINLMTGNVQRAAMFLMEVLDFRLSDYTEPEPNIWTAAWLRAGEHHHDLAFTRARSADETMHHVAWRMASFEHIKVALDMLAAAGTRIEFGPSRHPVGSNLFAYFWEPGGNRFELSAEGAFVPSHAVAGKWKGPADTLDAWGGGDAPVSFLHGS